MRRHLLHAALAGALLGAHAAAVALPINVVFNNVGFSGPACQAGDVPGTDCAPYTGDTGLLTFIPAESFALTGLAFDGAAIAGAQSLGAFEGDLRVAVAHGATGPVNLVLDDTGVDPSTVLGTTAIALSGTVGLAGTGLENLAVTAGTPLDFLFYLETSYQSFGSIPPEAIWETITLTLSGTPTGNGGDNGAGPVPEPASLALLGLGLAALGLGRRRRRA